MSKCIDPNLTEGYLVKEEQYLNDELINTRWLSPINALFYSSVATIDRYVGGVDGCELNVYYNAAGKHHFVRTLLKAKVQVEEV